MRHISRLMKEQIPIWAWMTRIFQHQSEGGGVGPKQVWADPFQVAWHWVMEQRGA